MSLFSELLKDYVKKSHISISKLSAKIEIDRSLFHKYLSGDRIPKNVQEVVKIGNAMMLLPKQQEKLTENFAKSVYGEKNYKSFDKIRQILEGMYDLRMENPHQIFDMDIVRKVPFLKTDEGAAFYGKLQVEDALTQLLWLAGGKNKKKHIKMIVQPNQKTIIKTILRVCSHLNLELEHIICLDCKQTNNDNISLLFSVLAFEFCNITYQSYFYYDDIDHHVNQMSLLPNMILIEEFVFLCDNEAEECLIVQQKTEVAFFKREYEKKKSNTKKLSIMIQDLEELTKTIAFLTENGKLDIQIGYTPFFIAGINEKMLEQHLLLEPKIKAQVIRTIKGYLTQIAEKEGFRSYFSESGLRKFMESGTFSEYPKEIFLPFTMQERIVILNRIIQLLKADYVSFYMSNIKQIYMEDVISIETNKEGGVMFWCKNGLYGNIVLIKELSIWENVHQFVSFAEENSWFYSKEETIEQMEHILEEFSKI